MNEQNKKIHLLGDVHISKALMINIAAKEYGTSALADSAAYPFSAGLHVYGNLSRA